MKRKRKEYRGNAKKSTIIRGERERGVRVHGPAFLPGITLKLEKTFLLMA